MTDVLARPFGQRRASRDGGPGAIVVYDRQHKGIGRSRRCIGEQLADERQRLALCSEVVDDVPAWYGPQFVVHGRQVNAAAIGITRRTSASTVAGVPHMV